MFIISRADFKKRRWKLRQNSADERRRRTARISRSSARRSLRIAPRRRPSRRAPRAPRRNLRLQLFQCPQRRRRPQRHRHATTMRRDCRSGCRPASCWRRRSRPASRSPQFACTCAQRRAPRCSRWPATWVRRASRSWRTCRAKCTRRRSCSDLSSRSASCPAPHSSSARSDYPSIVRAFNCSYDCFFQRLCINQFTFRLMPSDEHF